MTRQARRIGIFAEIYTPPEYGEPYTGTRESPTYFSGKFQESIRMRILTTSDR